MGFLSREHAIALLVATLVASSAATPSAHGAGVEELANICADCHGTNGLSTDGDIPILAGQAYTVIEDNLRAFRDGARPCTVTAYRHGDTSRLPTSMCEIANRFSDDEITELAFHFEALEFVPVQQEFDPARVDAGREVHQRGGCEACHAKEGRETNGLACRLGGQWTPYLERAFEQIRAGQRSGPVVMTDAIRALSDEDVRNLLHFYASQRP